MKLIFIHTNSQKTGHRKDKSEFNFRINSNINSTYKYFKDIPFMLSVQDNDAVYHCYCTIWLI